MVVMDDLASLRTFLRDEDPRASAGLEALVAFEQQDWVTVFHDENSDGGGDLRVACLISIDDVEESLSTADFDLAPGDGSPGFTTYYQDGVEETRYLTVGADGAVPLVLSRSFSGRFPTVVELAEDFCLFRGLYEDRDGGSFCRVLSSPIAPVPSSWA